jgi:ADP-ribose pyrophosphatase
MVESSSAPERKSNEEVTVSSEMKFRGRILNLRVDKVRMPNGVLTTREIAEHSESICAVPLDGMGNVLMVKQYRKPTESELLEIVAGGIEDGEDPAEATIRELKEEIGYTAGKLELLSSFWLAPGWCTEFMYAYLATDLSPSKLSADDDEQISVITVPLNTVPSLIQSGEIQDVKSIAALLLAMRAKP